MVPPTKGVTKRCGGQDQANDRGQEGGQGDPDPAAHAQVAGQRRRLAGWAAALAPTPGPPADGG